MVVLTAPLMHGGRILPLGTQLQLTPEFEATLVTNGHATRADEETYEDFYPGRANFMRVATEVLGKRGRK